MVIASTSKNGSLPTIDQFSGQGSWDHTFTVRPSNVAQGQRFDAKAGQVIYRLRATVGCLAYSGLFVRCGNLERRKASNF